MSFKSDRAFERATRWLHKAALGVVFFQTASEVDDRERNTDVNLVVGAHRVACRTRQDVARKHWRLGPDVTLRWSRPSGAKTEHEKFMQGWGDFLSYGLVTGAECFESFVIVDLAALRRQIDATSFASPDRGIRHNRDGTELLVLKTLTMWPECIRAAFRWPVTRAQAEHAHRQGGLLAQIPGRPRLDPVQVESFVLDDQHLGWVRGDRGLGQRPLFGGAR